MNNAQLAARCLHFACKIRNLCIMDHQLTNVELRAWIEIHLQPSTLETLDPTHLQRTFESALIMLTGRLQYAASLELTARDTMIEVYRMNDIVPEDMKSYRLANILMQYTFLGHAMYTAIDVSDTHVSLALNLADIHTRIHARIPDHSTVLRCG